MAAELLARATSNRHGVISAPVDIPRSAADLPGVHHASVADLDTSSSLKSAGGGVGRTTADARIAATAEALERYAAGTAELTIRPAHDIDEPVLTLDRWTLHAPSQQADPAFPDADAYPREPGYTPVHATIDNRRCWVPASLVALRRDYGALATSSGLAAHFSPIVALLRAIQELVERDAYVTTWLHGLAGRRIDVASVQTEVAATAGRVAVYDLTPAFSPHPVACVAGSLPLRGRPRNSLGLACRSTWTDAVEKAFLEFAQGTLFVGHQLVRFPQLEDLLPATCTGFDHHAVYWTVHDAEWWQLPIHQANDVSPPPPDSDATTPARALHELVTELETNGIRLFHRLLPTAGLDQIGLRVVRALSPDLVPLHHDHNWPFLGGTAPDWRRRYPHGEPQTGFPSPHPHALG